MASKAILSANTQGNMSTNGAPLTRAQVLEYVQEWESVISRWEDKDDPLSRSCKNPGPETWFMDYRGERVKAITHELDESFKLLFDRVDVETCEVDAMELILTIDAFADEYYRFVDKAQRSDANPGGTQELWQAFEQVLAVANRRKNTVTQARPAELRRQGVFDRQIAIIWELFNEDGQPDIKAVAEEIEKPGSRIDYESFEPYHTKKKRLEHIEKWEARSNRRRQRRDESPTRNMHVSSESVEDLLRQGVSSQQIAMMKSMEQDAVIAFARAMKLPVDNYVPGPALTPAEARSRERRAEVETRAEAFEAAAAQDDTAPQKPVEKAEAEGEMNTYPELPTTEERIRQMAFDGWSAEKIHTALKTEGVTDAGRARVREIQKEVKAQTTA